MHNQSSRLQNATVAGGNIGDPIHKEKVSHFEFYFSRPFTTQFIDVFCEILLWFLFFIFLFLPRTHDHVVVVVAVVVDEEKTFNWGEKRENWKNYNDKGTLGEGVTERVQGWQRRRLVYEGRCARVMARVGWTVSLHRVTTLLQSTTWYGKAMRWR